MATLSSGIVYDNAPQNPKIALMLPSPREEDVVDRKPLASKMAWYWRKKIFEKVGLKVNDILVTYLVRCFCGKSYPKGKWVRQAESACRFFDRYHGENGKRQVGGFVDSWEPNLFVATYDLSKTVTTGAFYRQTCIDLEKAVSFYEKGYRPMVLCGIEAVQLVCPHIGKGGIRVWRGHWWEGEWPFKEGYQEDDRGRVPKQLPIWDRSTMK